MNNTKLQNILAIEPSYIETLTEQINNAKEQASKIDKLIDLEKIDSIEVSKENGVAVVSINGPIMAKIPNIYKYYDMIDILELRGVIKDLEQDPEVTGAVFYIDSPGGTVQGVPEMADLIRGMSKPTIGFTDGLACSAGYWLYSACNALYASPSASVLSVGVYQTLIDSTKYYESKGLKVELIKAGTLKGIGVSGTPLTKEGKDHLQQSVDDIYNDFKEAVRLTRVIDDDYLQGQSMHSKQALSVGGIDSIGSLEDAIRDVKTLSMIYNN